MYYSNVERGWINIALVDPRLNCQLYYYYQTVYLFLK